MIIIGITGTYRAGKGAVVGYLKEQGFKHYSASGFIKEWMELTKPPQDRNDLIKGGNEIRNKYGTSEIIRSLVRRAERFGGSNVIESIRNPAEAEFLKSRPNCFLIAVDADPQIRYKRAQDVKDIKDNVTFEEFLMQEQKEMHSADPFAQNIARCIELADFKIMNNGTLDELYQQIEGVTTEIGRSGKERKY